MVNNARRYILNVSEVISCGLGTSYGNPVECNILNQFNVNYDTTPPTSCTYPEITTDDLMSLSELEYQKRVIDYVDTLKIDSELTKERLLDDASFIEPECVLCRLNEDFLVYKFLSGVRVVNIGEVTGIAQYKIYPSDEDPDNFSWQTSPTFLNLDQTEVYIVEVRDLLQNVELCKVSTLISMPLLIPSTTLIPQDKIIRIVETSNGDTSNVAYSTGCIEIVPPLQPREMLRLDYIANAFVVGGGSSCVQIACKPEESASFVNYCCVTNTDNNLPVSVSIPICHGDVVCYNVTSYGETFGSRAEGEYQITSIDGLGTINPTIDETSCSVIVQKNIAPITTIVSFADNTGNTTLNRCTINGRIDFSEPVPMGQCLTIQLSGLSQTVGGASSTVFSCKPNGTTEYLTYCTISNVDNQPQFPELIACGGDEFCYDITLDVPNAGNSSSLNLCINELTGSLGVVPILNEALSANTICVQINIPTISTEISVCRLGSTSISSDGFINLNPELISSNQYVSALIGICQVSQDNRFACLEFYCKPSNGSSFIRTNNYEALNNDVNDSISITFRCGDVVCYNNSIASGTGSTCSSFAISGVTSSIDISPTINSSKNDDVVSSF